MNYRPRQWRINLIRTDKDKIYQVSDNRFFKTEVHFDLADRVYSFTRKASLVLNTGERVFVYFRTFNADTSTGEFAAITQEILPAQIRT